jgi:hypothetical protein
MRKDRRRVRSSDGSEPVKKSGIAETSVREIARLRRTERSISELLHKLSAGTIGSVGEHSEGAVEAPSAA